MYKNRFIKEMITAHKANPEDIIANIAMNTSQVVFASIHKPTINTNSNAKEINVHRIFKPHTALNIFKKLFFSLICYFSFYLL